MSFKEQITSKDNIQVVENWEYHSDIPQFFSHMRHLNQSYASELMDYIIGYIFPEGGQYPKDHCLSPFRNFWGEERYNYEYIILCSPNLNFLDFIFHSFPNHNLHCIQLIVQTRVYVGKIKN